MSTTGTGGASGTATGSASWGPLQWVGAVLAWLWVLVPFGYGLFQLLIKIPSLFG